MKKKRALPIHLDKIRIVDVRYITEDIPKDCFDDLTRMSSKLENAVLYTM